MGLASERSLSGKLPSEHWLDVDLCDLGVLSLSALWFWVHFFSIISKRDILNSSVGSNFLNTQSTYILYPWTSDVYYSINQILLIASCSYGENSKFQMKVMATAEINTGFIYSSVCLSNHVSFSFCYSWPIQ